MKHRIQRRWKRKDGRESEFLEEGIGVRKGKDLWEINKKM